jgi:hypothetical protein
MKRVWILLTIFLLFLVTAFIMFSAVIYIGLERTAVNTNANSTVINRPPVSPLPTTAPTAQTANTSVNSSNRNSTVTNTSVILMNKNAGVNSNANASGSPATSNSNNQNAQPQKKDEGLFSFPPPKAVHYALIPNRDLLNSDGQTTFQNVSDKLATALENAGYNAGDRSFFGNSADEFAIVTKIERIQEDGAPLKTDARWDDSSNLPTARSPSEYLNYLIDGKKIVYRVFAFVVTPKTYNFYRNSPPSFEMAKEWMNKGEPVLGGEPGGVQDTIFTDKYKCYVLLYLFINHTSLDAPKSIDRLEENEKYLIAEMNRDTHSHLAATKIKLGER